MGKGIKRVLLIGNGQFYHVGAFFRTALVDLGYECCFIDEGRFFPQQPNSLLGRGLARIQNLLNEPIFNQVVIHTAVSFQPDLALVLKGSYIYPSVLKEIKFKSRTLLVNFATDNPFNPYGSTSYVVEAIPEYDLYVTPTRALIPDLKRAGAGRMAWIPFAYEPSLHFPERPKTPEEEARWASDVVFVGLCDQDRIPFLRALSEVPGLRLRLYGGYWERVPELRRFGNGFVFRREYRFAQGMSRIALTIIRRANRNGHTMRSFEIPACGGFLLAERTEEHLEFFEEGKEMACFSSPEELVDKVRYYLSHDGQRQRIAEAGYRRVMSGKHSYQDRLMEILRAVDHV